MAWKIYIMYPDLTIPVQGSFKTEEDAKLFYRRNKQAFTRANGSTGTPVYVDQGNWSELYSIIRSRKQLARRLTNRWRQHKTVKCMTHPGGCRTTMTAA